MTDPQKPKRRTRSAGDADPAESPPTTTHPVADVSDGIEHTLEEVGLVFGVTRERIRQIEAKALKKLRQPSRSRFLRDFVPPAHATCAGTSTSEPRMRVQTRRAVPKGLAVGGKCRLVLEDGRSAQVEIASSASEQIELIVAAWVRDARPVRLTWADPAGRLHEFDVTLA